MQCINLLADGAGASFGSYLAEKPLALVGAFDPYLPLALSVVSESVISHVHAVFGQKIKPICFKIGCLFSCVHKIKA